MVHSGFPGQELILETYQSGQLRERRRLVAGDRPIRIDLPIGPADRGGLFVRLFALRDYDLGRFHTRFLRLFQNDPDRSVRRFCIEFLTDSTLNGVTEALVNAILHPSKAVPEWEERFVQDQLRDTLNKRLKTSFRKVEALQDFVRTQTPQKQ